MIYAYFGKCELKYFGLFVADNDNSAIRVVEQEIQRNQKLQDYSMEYSLYCLCDFNEDSGVLSSPTLRFVSDLSDILINYITRQRKQHEILKQVSGVELEDEGFSSSVQLSDSTSNTN